MREPSADFLVHSILLTSLFIVGCSPDHITGKDGAPMVKIPADEFQMGNASERAEADESPVHAVYLDTFYMDAHEVTNAQYQVFLEATGLPYAQKRVAISARFDEQPVVGVNWEDARLYCEWAEKRLPTEAEWEKAARSKLVGQRFPWGEEPPDADGIYRANYNPGIMAADGYRSAAPVGSYHPNGYGLYDMAGNVWEWCSDWYDRNYYARSPKKNPKGPDAGSARVMRGGGWDSEADTLRVSYRAANHPLARSNSIGFRCAKDE